jgi:hypothetical protein
MEREKNDIGFCRQRPGILGIEFEHIVTEGTQSFGHSGTRS